jgi:hypothetical protein
MAETKERRKIPRKATPKPDSKAAAPRKPTSEQRTEPFAGSLRSESSPEEIRRQIEEAAYFRAKQRGFEPGHELEDWMEAESEVLRRNSIQ